MTDTDQSGLTKRVCAWCSTRTGQNYFELVDRTPASHDGAYYCTRDCLVSALMYMDEGGKA